MHELGVVFYVVKDVKKVAEENHVEKVSAVTLEIGEIYLVRKSGGKSGLINNGYKKERKEGEK